MNEVVPATGPDDSGDPPWLAGWQAARANLVPGFVVQAVMIGTVLAYFHAPSIRPLFDTLATWKADWGFLYSAVSGVVAGAIIPELLRIAVFQKGRPHRRNLGNFLFAAAFWGLSGMQVDLLYRMQGVWFGQDAGLSTVIKKVLVDQLLYCPLIAAPQGVILYDWRARHFSRNALGGFFTAGFYRRSIFPTLFANWVVWCPVVAALYSLPALLQIPLFSLALSLWVILFTWMSEQRTGRTAALSPPRE